MALRSAAFACVLGIAISGCGEAAPPAELPPAIPDPPVVAPQAANEPQSNRPPEQPSDVPPPTVDLLTASSLEARIVSLHKLGWVPCGRAHSVGAVEVEVLGAGEPRPHLFLYVSCPADAPLRDVLVEGARVKVELFAGKQSWPRPPVDVGELPVRYVKGMTPILTGA